MLHRWGRQPGGRFPDFLVIGATRAGTSWLYQQLDLHPSVWFPGSKEQHFFDRRWGQHTAAYTYRYRKAGPHVAGDITPAYLTMPDERVRFVRHVMPRARIVVILRDPVRRAWSNLLYNARRGRYAFADPRTADPAAVDAVARSQPLTERSRYVRSLEVWGNHFPRQQVAVLPFEGIERAPERLLNRVCTHLGVPSLDWDGSALRRRHNAAGLSSPMPERLRRRWQREFAEDTAARPSLVDESLRDLVASPGPAV